MKLTLLLLILLFFASNLCLAQSDNSIEALQTNPVKNIFTINNKVDKYNQRVTDNTLDALSIENEVLKKK